MGEYKTLIEIMGISIGTSVLFAGATTGLLYGALKLYNVYSRIKLSRYTGLNYKDVNSEKAWKISDIWSSMDETKMPKELQQNWLDTRRGNDVEVTTIVKAKIKNKAKLEDFLRSNAIREYLKK